MIWDNFHTFYDIVFDVTHWCYSQMKLFVLLRFRSAIKLCLFTFFAEYYKYVLLK